jgi:hypothetical protein
MPITRPSTQEDADNRLREAFIIQDFGALGGEVESYPLPDRNALLYSSATSAWAERILGVPANPYHPGWQGQKDGIVRSYFGEREAKDVSDEDLFGKIATDYRAQEKIANAARIAAARGESWLGKFREVETQEAGSIIPGRMTNYLGLARAAHDEMAAKVNPYRNTIKAVADMARNIDTSAEGMDWGAMASELVKIPKEDRPYVLEALSLQTPGESKAGDAERIKTAFVRGMERYLDTAVSSLETAGESTAGEFLRQSYGFDVEAQTPEQKAQRADFLDLRDDMRDIATGKLAPLKAVKIAGMNIAGAAEMLPMTLGSFVPYVGAAVTLGSFQRSTYNDIRRSNPEMSRDSANAIATVSAPFQTITEIASDRFLFGRLPNLKRAFTQPIFSATGALGMFATRAAIGTATEVSEEFIQGVTPLAIQDLSKALGQDLPGSDWNGFLGEFAQSLPELISTILPLAIVGAGTGQLSDFRAGRQLARSPDMLIAAQYSPESAAKISELANAGKWSEAEDAMRLDWAKINAKGADMAQVKATAEQRIQAAERLKSLQSEQANTAALIDTSSPEFVVNVTRSPAGWQVAVGDGTIIPVDSVEAARRIAVDLRQVGNQKEAEVMADILNEYYASGMGRGAQVEMTGETVGATGNIVSAIRRDASGAPIAGSARVFDEKALEEVRAEAAAAGFASDTQDVFARINGSNEVFPQQVGDTAKGIWRILSLFESRKNATPQVATLLHEDIESKFTLGLINKSWTIGDIQKAFAGLLPAFANITAPATLTDEQIAKMSNKDQEAYYAKQSEFNWINNVRKIVAGDYDAAMLRETFSEMYVRDRFALDRKGRATGLPAGLISRGIEAAVMGAKTQEEASVYKRFRAMFKAFSAHFKAVFKTVQTMVAARKEGKIGEDWDSFVNKVLGIDEVKQLESQAVEAGKAILGVDAETQAVIDAGNMAFSMSRAQPADTSNVTEMPDGAQIVGPTTFRVSDSLSNANPIEDSADAMASRSAAEAKVIADFAKTPSFQAEGLGSLDVPSQRAVMLGVFRVGHDLKVLDSVVEFIPIDVMDMLRAKKLTPEALFNNQAMFEELFVPDRNGTIAEGRDSAEALLRAIALGTAKSSAGDFAGTTVNDSATDGARDVHILNQTQNTSGGQTFSLTVYHGTPHKFDKFKTSKIGTGEGNQAFGWGLYFAESRMVAKQYQASVTSKQPGNTASLMWGIYGSGENFWIENGDLDRRGPFKTRSEAEAALLEVMGEKGNLYTVELLPDEEDFLDWDKPLSEQSEKVKAALAGIMAFAPAPNGATPDGQSINSYFGGGRAASEKLASLGIPGIRYLDGSSRAVGEGTSNYVIFDESLIKILEENGQKVEAGNMAFSISPVLENERITPENKVASSINGKPAADIFAKVKKRHGITRSIYEAGYVLPDGTMLDFSGRADAGGFTQGADLVFRAQGRDYMKDQRGVDHREIEWQDMPEYKETWEPMAAFLRLGAVRVDANSGMISMHSRAKITSAQASALKSIVIAADGAYIDLEDDAKNRSSMQLDGGKWGKVNGLLTRWANGETPEFEGVTYSISPIRNLNELSDQVERNFAENPAGALEVKSKVIRQFAKLADKWSNERWAPQGNKIRPISEKRTVKSLDKEQAMRQAQREVELVNEGMDKLTPDTLMAYSEGVGTLEDDPLVKKMLHDNGRLMSKATAAREGRDIKDQYDDLNWIPPQWYSNGRTIKTVVITRKDGSSESFPSAKVPAEIKAAIKSGEVKVKINKVTIPAVGGIMPDVMANNLGFDTASEMWAALESSIKSHRNAKADYAKAEAAVKAVEKAAFEQARQEAQAWRDEADAMQKEDWSPRESLVRDLITLEAIVAMFPQEIRGKIGGFVTLARKASEAARLKVLQRQLERGQELLEKHLKEQYGKAVDKLLERYQSKRDSSGRISGKILSTATEQVDYAAEFIDLDIASQAKEQAALEKQVEESESAEEVQDALTKLGIARLFEVWSTKDSASRESAFLWLNEIIEQGKQGKKLLDEERKAFLDDMRQSGQASILQGDELNAAVADNLTNLNKGVMRRALLGMRGVLSESLWTTLQRLELIFGEDSKILDYFAGKIINAANLSTDIKRLVEAQKRDALTVIFNSDSKFAHARGIAELQKLKDSGIMISKVTKKEIKLDIDTLTKLADGTMDAKTAGLEQAEVDAALEEFAANARKRMVTIEKVTSRAAPTSRTMSETQGIQWWLWSMQEASRKQMERDGWDADSFAQLEEFLSPEAKALGRWISGSYQDAAGMIDPIYRKLFNAPLPRIKNYSPIHRRNMNAGGEVMDLDSSDMNSGLAAGFTKSRVNTTASLVESDALAVFLAHWENVSHWVAHAELMRDMKAILLDKDTAVAIRQKKSEGYLQRLKQDISTIEKNGTNSANELVNMSRFWRWLMQYRAYKGLAFRISPIIKQTPALLNPLLADVPAHNYMMGMSRAFIEPQAFASEVSAMWKSDIIRRRIESGFSAESRVAMQGSSMTGSQAILAMQAGMMPMGMVDGGWTALGAAISFDYYRRGYMRENPQMTPEIADAKAIARVEKMIATSAQPSDIYARALYERSGNPFMRSMSMFVSDQRKALAVELMAIRKLATGKSKNKSLDVQRAFVAHIVQAAVSQVMAGVIASLLGDDEDRDREWSTDQWTLALTLGPVNGLFVAGRLIDKGLRSILGLRVFPSDNLADKAFVDIWRAGKNMDDIFSDDPEDVINEIDNLSAAAGAGLSAAFGPAAGAVDVSANVLREARKIQDRLSE